MSYRHHDSLVSLVVLRHQLTGYNTASSLLNGGPAALTGRHNEKLWLDRA